MVLELQGADGVGNAFDGILDGMGEVIHGIDAPFVTRILVGHMRYTVDDGIAHIDIGGSHVDLCTEGQFAVCEFTVLHAFKKIQVLFNASVSVGIVDAGLGQGAAVFAHLLSLQGGDISLALFDQLHGHFIHFLEIIGGKVETVLIVGAQPLDILLDGFDELGFFLGGVGVIETQVELAAVLLGQSVVEQNALGMADVEIAVGLGRETGMHGIVDTLRQILIDGILNEIPAFFCCFFCGYRCSASDFLAHFSSSLVMSLNMFINPKMPEMPQMDLKLFRAGFFRRSLIILTSNPSDVTL